MLTKTIAKEIIIQLKEVTNHSISLFNEKGMHLSSTNKKTDYLTINDKEKDPLFFFNYHFGFFHLQGNEDVQTKQLIKALIEMSYGQHLLLSEDTFTNKTIESFIEIIKNNTVNSEAIKKLELRLGVLFSPPYQVAIGQIDQDKAYVYQLINNLFKGTPVLVHFLTNNQFCLISYNNSSNYFNSKLKELVAQLQLTTYFYKIGVSPSIISYHLLNEAMQEAMDAFHFSTNTIIFYNEILLESLITSSSPTKREHLVKNVLKDLTDKYFDTIEKFCQYNLNIADCSKAMFIHRNSLIYRLKKIHEITGLNPMKANDLFLLKIALKLKKIDFQ